MKILIVLMALCLFMPFIVWLIDLVIDWFERK